MDNQDIEVVKALDETEKDIFADSAEELERNGDKVTEEAIGYMLPSGDALDEEELYLLTARRNTRIIYVLGPVGSGKTTFESMLYDCFLRNIDEELLFAGSETLQGYEERLNNLRVVSGSSEAKMQRTKLEEKHCFLQLYLKSKHDQYSVVFADVSGELFDQCVANRTNMETNLRNLELAQNIVLFIDGEALIDKAKRQGAVSKLRTFLQTLKSSDLYSFGRRVDIIISKNDIIHEKARECEDRFIENINNKFSDLMDDYMIRFYRIEALNGNNTNDEKSTQLLQLLKIWLNTDDIKSKENVGGAKKIKLRNEFNRYGEKG